MTHRASATSAPLRVITPRLVPRVPRLRAGAWNRRATVVGLAVVMIATAGLVALDAAGPAGEGSTAGVVGSQRIDLRAFERDLDPVTADAAKVVGAGLRAGVDDIYADRYDDATLAAMTTAWRDDLTRLRDRLTTIETPTFLGAVHRGFVASFDGYVEVAELLVAAVAVHGDERRALVMQAAHAGEAADEIYDRAEADLNGHRSRLGLPTSDEPSTDGS